MITVAITGASGVQYGIRLLEVLKELQEETQLVVTYNAQKIIEAETNSSLNYIRSLAAHTYDENDFTAPIASGSCLEDSMVVAPCSMKTVGSIASGVSSNLVARAADVCLKERRRLILVIRETPLNMIHLSNLLKVAQCGAIVVPASPGFYTRPSTIPDLIDILVARVLDLLHINHALSKRWGD
ncbi:MAG: UbiX family flavin prenyltransferase [Halobacteriota archaeon]